MEQFRDAEDGLLFLIIVYQVAAQSVNLDPYCSRVLMATPAINALSEIQAWSRRNKSMLCSQLLLLPCTGVKNQYLIELLQVLQKKLVQVLHLLTSNSHDEY